MELFFREFGDTAKAKLVVLHGLLGSSRNWQTAARDLADDFHVICFDLRNHGESAHASPHSFEAMCVDLLESLEALGIQSCFLMGHSMGGKVAGKFACENPGRVDRLIVVDIVPKTYPKTHDDEFLAMREIEKQKIRFRSEAEIIIEGFVDDWSLRKFLLTNLVRLQGGAGFRWQINLDAIEAALRDLEKSPLSDDQRFEDDSLFLMGGKSNYYHPSDDAKIHHHFPLSVIEIMEESGHNPHFESRGAFVGIVREFLLRE